MNELRRVGKQQPGLAASTSTSGRIKPEPAYTGFVKFRVILEHDPVAQSYSAVCPELPGCTSAGDTETEARENIEEAIRLYLAPSDIDLPESANSSR